MRQEPKTFNNNTQKRGCREARIAKGKGNGNGGGYYQASRQPFKRERRVNNKVKPDAEKIQQP
jgi:hypothetical protein